MPEDIQGSQQVDTQPQSTPEVTPQPSQPDVSTQPQQGTEITGSRPIDQPDVPDYTPNYKFKAYNKEHEIEEWARPLIANKELEDKFRKLHELAYGFSTFKPDYEQLKQTYPEMQKSFSQLHGTVSEILDYRDKGDLDSFFEATKVPVEKVAEWMLQKINRQNLPPDQKKVYDEYDNARKTTSSQEKQIQELSQQTQMAIAETRQLQLNAVLARPDVSAIANNYNSTRGNDGAFWNLVKQIGETEWHARQVDLSAEEAVKKAIELLGPAYANMPGQPMGAPTSQAADKPLPVIPKVAGRNVSATNRSPRSVEDLKKMYNDLARG